MTTGQYPHDLVVLVADKNMEFAVKGILGRAQAMGTREPVSIVHVHPEKDPGCLLRGHDFISLFQKQCAHALILLDFDHPLSISNLPGRSAWSGALIRPLSS